MRLDLRLAFVSTVLAALVAAQNAPAAEITTDTVAHVIRLQGPIVLGDDDRFEQALALDHGQTILVGLASGGGAVIPALAIGRRIHQMGLNTLVPVDGLCASACGLIFLAGKTRFVGEGSHIGFHSAAVTGPDGQSVISGPGTALEGGYLAGLGAKDAAIMYMTTAAPQAMTWITLTDAAQMGFPLVLVPRPEPLLAPVPLRTAMIQPGESPAPAPALTAPPPSPMPPQRTIADAEPILPPRPTRQKPKLVDVAKLLEQLPDEQPAPPAPNPMSAPAPTVIAPPRQGGICGDLNALSTPTMVEALQAVFGGSAVNPFVPGEVNPTCVHVLALLHYHDADVLVAQRLAGADFSHASPAHLTAYVMSIDGGQLRLVATLRDFAQVGTWGSVSGPIIAVQIGGGIEVRSGGTAKGQTIERTNFYRFTSGTVVRVGLDDP